MKNYTEIVTILDMSGSMGSIRNDAFGTINTFITQQKALPDEANLTLILFNDKAKTICEYQDIHRTNLLTEDQYRPTGSTALLDAMGEAIDSLGNRLNKMKEKDRPNKVLFVIYTDGEENSSTKYSHSQLKEMIERQQNTYSWEFLYFGANQDAFAVSKDYGFKASNTMSYTADSQGVLYSMNNLSATVSNYRTTGSSVIVDTEVSNA